MKNLAHSASFDSEDKDAPSKPGIKHLGLAWTAWLQRLLSSRSL
ncbi:hypothetical protein CUJ84_pRLN3000336 (plasmid) [Rhizobium leguminosarum]|uniref:Uncharacterized protein n=1 Tax=Rhizobium leguminosarum TaxID=384 RepID=A0A2K9ZGW4_RHILE|nr:hypothetical protein CUJ84_pRLN3000336 [Rhizobium leguminosarum]